MAALVYVVDTTALLAKWVLLLPIPAYTTSLVAAEAKDPESREATNTALMLGKLRIIDPPQEAVKAAEDAAKKMGLYTSLSIADISVAALAIHLSSKHAGSIVVVTDDYALQNLVAGLGFRFQPLRTRGIREERQYIIRCPACGYVSSKPGEKICPVCGTPLRRYTRRRRRAIK
jgi:UPF0271 protein